MFAKAEVKAMVETFVAHFPHLEKRLLLSPGPVEMQALITSYTLDCFCALALGIETETLAKELCISFASH
jgi:hypothetical protein